MKEKYSIFIKKIKDVIFGTTVKQQTSLVLKAYDRVTIDSSFWEVVSYANDSNEEHKL